MELTRWLRGLIVRFRTRNDLYNERPDRHPALARVQVGERFPFKGTIWRVASIRSEPVPVIILVPLVETRASQVHALRKLRRMDRMQDADEQFARDALRRRGRED